MEIRNYNRLTYAYNVCVDLQIKFCYHNFV